MELSASFAGWIGLLFVSGVPSSDLFTLGVLVAGIGALAAVHGSLAYHLARISDLCRDLEDLYRSRPGGQPEARLRDLEQMMADSPVVEPWSTLLRRRHELDAKSPEDGAPVRFGELLEQQPLIPRGVRRSLLDSMPSLLAGLGIASSLAALAVGLASLEIDGAVAPIVGLGLRGAFWGLTLATAAGVASRLLEGSSQELGTRLSTLIERSYRAVSQDEISLRIAEAQLAGQERNSLLLLRLTKDLRESLNTGLGRIETATSSAFDAASDEQQRVLESVTHDLASQLQYRLEDQLGALRASIELRTNNPDKTAHIDSNVDSRTSAVLERAASAVEKAAAAFANEGDSLEVTGVLEHAVTQIAQAQQETGESGDSADALAGLRQEVTRMHEQMVESVMAEREADSEPAASAPGAAPAPVPAADSAPAPEAAVASDDPRSGYSALLHRYEAPRFSLDELAPELRAFDSEAAIERARAAGVAPGDSLTAGPDAQAPAEDTPLAEKAEAEPEKAPDDQRLRLARFLRKR